LAGGSYVDLCFAWGVGVSTFYGAYLGPTATILGSNGRGSEEVIVLVSAFPYARHNGDAMNAKRFPFAAQVTN
jgi:hypothetical protein